MANQLRPSTIDAIAVLAQRDWSQRRIAIELGVNRCTVGRYIRLWSAGVPGDREDRRTHCDTTNGAAKRGNASIRDLLQARLSSGATIKAIHRELISAHDFRGSYYSVRRLARQLRRNPRCRIQRDTAWMTSIWQGTKTLESLQEELKNLEGVARLFAISRNGTLKARKKALTILARHMGIPNARVAAFLHLRSETTRRYCRLFANEPSSLFAPRMRRKVMDNPDCVEAVVSTLHSPPSAHGINRTTWKQEDLHRVLAGKGFHVSARNIRAILRKQGYRWRKARKVLTSRDPEYRTKVERIRTILANIGPNQRFFSIDEFGPFAITHRGGRKLVGPGEEYTVPQRQKSKGSLIITAALELCTNQVVHFYSKRKNTEEMLHLLEVLTKEYSGMEMLYLSWDAASWHLSRRFEARVAEVNAQRESRPELPRIELAPLPSGAQFLNVIESVFSGMARAIIHNSQYQSTEEAMQAIDRYFRERNAAFKEHPRPAGKKIWGKERVKAEFSEANNCKDPNW